MFQYVLHIVCIHVESLLCLYEDSLTYILHISIYKIPKLRPVFSTNPSLKDTLYFKNNFYKPKPK